jgi:Fe-S-cluster containining protein
VTVSRRDPVCRLHPELIVDRGRFVEIRRQGERCAALAGGPAGSASFECVIYPDRPRPCREFEQGSLNCLEARRRVGLSPW